MFKERPDVKILWKAAYMVVSRFDNCFYWKKYSSSIRLKILEFLLLSYCIIIFALLFWTCVQLSWLNADFIGYINRLQKNEDFGKFKTSMDKSVGWLTLIIYGTSHLFEEEIRAPCWPQCSLLGFCIQRLRLHKIFCFRNIPCMLSYHL